LRTSSGTSNHALQQKQAEVYCVSLWDIALGLSKRSPLRLLAGMQVHSVRETNRLLDGKLQQLQSQLHEQAASTKQARVSC